MKDSVAPDDSAVRVLVIDDSEIALDIVLELLERHSIPAIGLPGPIGATNTVARQGIRVVVTDVNMPELAGNSLVSLFRDNPRTQHVKVILLSDLPEAKLDELVHRSRAHGAVQKGKVEEELVPLVRHLLKVSKPVAGSLKAF